jgi:hypothetical protein
MTAGLHDALSLANAALSRGAAAEARRALVSAALETDADARSFEQALLTMKRAYEGLKDARALASVAFYAGATQIGRETMDAKLLAAAPPVDRGRLLRLAGDERAAAEAFEAGGWLAHAAVARERAGDAVGARTLFARLAHRLAQPAAPSGAASHAGTDREDGSSDPRERAAERAYVLGLARYDVARNAPATGGTTNGAARGAVGGDRREAIVAAVGALEEAAARFEALGLRERAFDCCNALAAIGATSATFEHSLEGRVNAIRILREDHLQSFALQQFDEAIDEAERAGELAAAAGFAREAMQYAHGLPGHDADARAFGRRALTAHAAAARALVRSGGPPELAENAMLAAIALAAEMGALATARALYLEAAALPGLDGARAARHRRGAERLAGAVDAAAEERARGTARASATSVEVWIVDLLEWEQRGRAEEAAADVLFDPAGNGSGARDASLLPLRRRALATRLIALDAIGREQSSDPEAIAIAVQLARRLGELVDYRALGPLEVLLRHPSAEVRARVVEVAGHLPFKRSAQLLRRAAFDGDARVLEAVAKAVVRKKSAVFVDPLRRLGLDAPTLEVRTAALRALSTIENAEAAETVLTALAAAPSADRAALVATLRTLRLPGNAALLQAARARLARGTSRELAADLEAALGVRA